MEDLHTFLMRYAPFSGLDPHEVARFVAETEELRYEPGELVLVEDGVPAQGLYVIRQGSMDIVHDGEPIQVLAAGECFGHPSLLTGMAPAFTVRARERSVCARFSAPASRRLLSTEPGATYIAQTLRRRLVTSGQAARSRLVDLSTTPVSTIIRPAVFCSPEMSIREAASRLGRDGVDALLMWLPENKLGIVSDADVRARVAQGDGALDSPVQTIVRTPVPTVPVGQLAIEATVDMLAAGTEHLAVVDGSQVMGILSAADLLGLDASSPIALRRAILEAGDEAGLARAVGELGRLFGLLMRAGVPPADVARVLTLQHDAIVTRLIDFALEAQPPAPVPWAWLDLGSAARGEFTLASDQDNALAYAAPPPGAEAKVDAYFARLGREVNEGLARCGIGNDNNGVLAGNRLWRMSDEAWVRTFDECLEVPDESHLIRATVAFDFRSVGGGLAVTGELTERIRAARHHPRFMRLIARVGAGYPVALGFRGQLATGRDGDAPGRLDLKRGGVIPLVNLVRYHALASGVTISSTLDRLEAVVGAGGLDRAAAEALEEAFEVIMRLRFEHHAALIAAGRPVDNLIDPATLSPIAVAELREALAVVRRAQRVVGAATPSLR